MKKLTKKQKEVKFRACLSAITAYTNAILTKKIHSKVKHEKFGINEKLFRNDGHEADDYLRKVSANKKLFTQEERDYLEVTESTDTVWDAMIMLERLTGIALDDCTNA